MTPIDALIIGAGHHGLTCAAYLGRAGKRVVVLEAEAEVGGMTRAADTVPEAPGFVMNTCAADSILLQIPRSIVGELGLSAYGLRFVAADPYCSWLHPDGASIGIWRDLDRAAGEMARFSRKDADRYRRFASALIDLWYVAMPYVQGHPRRPGIRVLGEMLLRAAKSRKRLGTAARIMAQSPTESLEEWFERDEIKTALALWTLAGMTDLDTPGGAAVMSMFVLTHRWGCSRVVGGMGAFSGALAACARAYGGRIRTNARVKEVIVEDGGAAGVVLDGGEEIFASHVIAALDPHTLVTQLLDPSVVPTQTRDELRGMSVLRRNLSTFKGDVALSGRPTFPQHVGRDEQFWRSGYVMMAPDLDYVRRASVNNARGELGEEIPLWVSMPTMLDRTLVPDGSQGDSLYVYVPAVPYELSSGRSWSSEKDGYLDRCMDILESYAPGTRQSVIGQLASKSPEDLEELSYRGNIFGVDMTPAQIGPWRPVPSLAGYKTPIARLWHTSAGAHPVPAVNGWSGRTMARTLLRASR